MYFYIKSHCLLHDVLRKLSSFNNLMTEQYSVIYFTHIIIRIMIIKPKRSVRNQEIERQNISTIQLI